VVDARNYIAITNVFATLNSTVAEPAVGDGLVYYATKTPCGIRALNLTNFALAGTHLVTGVSGDVRSLVRWGVNGLAMHTTGGQIVILRSPLIPSSPEQDADADGMPDEWESRFGLNPHDDFEAAMDLDGDGLPTWENTGRAPTLIVHQARYGSKLSHFRTPIL
jgi:hypothetical protein